MRKLEESLSEDDVIYENEENLKDQVQDDLKEND